MVATVKGVRIERSSIIIELDKPTCLVSREGAKRIAPSYTQTAQSGCEIWFNLASCQKGGCLSGEWLLEGAQAQPFESISADFSKGSCRFAVDISCCEGNVVIKVDYSRTKVGVKDRITTLGLRTPYVLGRLFKGKKSRVLFASETRSSLSGNMEYVVSAAEGDFGGKEVLCSFKAQKSRLLYYLKTAFMAGRCDTVVVDDYFPLIYRLNFGNNRVFQLWHACGAFKAVGYSRLGKSGAAQPDDITHRNYTHVTVSSEQIVPFYAEAFGIPADRLIATGVPRTDIFFDKAVADQKQSEFYEKFPQFKGRQIFLFAPTFRGDGFNSAHYPFEMIDFAGLAEFCRKNNGAFIFKLHPFVKDFALPDGYGDVFADASEVREINDLLFAADVLITDYSSVIYEFSLLSRPIIFYTYDLAEYCKSRDFYMPIEQYAACGTVNSSEELVELLSSGGYKTMTADIIRSHSMSACDGKSAKRVSDMIFEK